MTIKNRVAGFCTLGKALRDLDLTTKTELLSHASAKNAWFTHQNIEMAMNGILQFLDKRILEQWLAGYNLPTQQKKVGLVLAGNIPLVGFHDFMSVLLAGHTAIIKPSSQDKVLLEFISNKLVEINPEFKEQIVFVDRLANIDAVIATGSDNSSRYFKKYFKDIPHIIRKNRTSVAILSGEESKETLQLLGNDIFSYFGLGCRNVAKIYIPEGYDITALLDTLENNKDIQNHSKYFNNYEYNKAIYLVNKVDHLDTGYALFRQNTDLISPLSVVYYEEYQNMNQLTGKLELYRDKLQCVVSNTLLNGTATIPIGQSQFPKIDDYADNIDTMEFLCDL